MIQILVLILVIAAIGCFVAFLMQARYAAAIYKSDLPNRLLGRDLVCDRGTSKRALAECAAVTMHDLRMERE